MSSLRQVLPGNNSKSSCFTAVLAPLGSLPDAVTRTPLFCTLRVENPEALAALESRQRIQSRQASGTAAREAERALALAEQARDLDSLMGTLDKAAALRQQLAALPGPVMRPARPEGGRPD